MSGLEQAWELQTSSSFTQLIDRHRTDNSTLEGNGTLTLGTPFSCRCYRSVDGAPCQGDLECAPHIRLVFETQVTIAIKNLKCSIESLEG